jgi:hypothetical protein
MGEENRRLSEVLDAVAARYEELRRQYAEIGNRRPGRHSSEGGSVSPSLCKRKSEESLAPHAATARTRPSPPPVREENSVRPRADVRRVEIQGTRRDLI